MKAGELLTEEQLKSNIAKNITELRKASELTQAQLAEKLNYSDKSVSKWERGDGVPDVVVLQKIADLFGVTLNDLVSENKPKLPRKLPYLTNRIMIPLLSVGLTFLVASIVFFVLQIAFIRISIRFHTQIKLRTLNKICARATGQETPQGMRRAE